MQSWYSNSQTMIKVETDQWGVKHLIWNDDVDVSLQEREDGTIFVQITTSPDSGSWIDLDVYMNDGKAVHWE